MEREERKEKGEKGKKGKRVMAILVLDPDVEKQLLAERVGSTAVSMTKCGMESMS